MPARRITVPLGLVETFKEAIRWCRVTELDAADMARRTADGTEREHLRRVREFPYPDPDGCLVGSASDIRKMLQTALELTAEQVYEACLHAKTPPPEALDPLLADLQWIAQASARHGGSA